MGISDKTNATPNLVTVALELFKGRSQQPGISPRQLAMTSFRDARIFLDAAEEALDQKLDDLSDDANPLDIAYAPNLKRTHPINLMSRAWGNLDSVKSVLAYLDAHPKADSYEPHSWGKPEVNQARALFPAVVNRASQTTNAK
jgi:hypothetical protein